MIGALPLNLAGNQAGSPGEYAWFGSLLPSREHGSAHDLCRRPSRAQDVRAVALGACSWQTDGVSTHVRLSGELSGEYVVDEVFDDGRIVLRPDTSAAAIRERAALDPVTDDEFEQAFGHLPSDSEG